MTSGHHPTAATAQPWWQREGLVVTGGWHPLAARIRRGIPPENIEADYDWEYSPQHIERLKQLGITLLLGQFDRGLSDIDQAEDQQRARDVATLCHQHGIHHGCYIANTVYFESMLKQHPDCADWVVHTHDHRFVHYGGQQTFRWVACFSAPGWRRRVEQQIDRAIHFVNTDVLHFDNLGLWPEPDSCHCVYCTNAFRAFLQRRYPTEASQKRRFGFAAGDFHTFGPPNFYLRFSPPWDMNRIDNPLMQDWMVFRQWSVTDYITHMAAYARQRKPGILIDSNGQGIWGCNQAMIHGVDHAAQVAQVDVICEENPDLRPDDELGAIFPVTHKFRGMNYARGLGKPTLTAYRDEQSLAFNLAFCGHPGINQAWGYSEPGRAALTEHQPGVRELLEHFFAHRPLYINTRSAARVALWRNNQSLSFVSTDTHLSACVLEQLLFDTRIPFRIVTDELVSSDQLSAFDLLILPDVEFISNAIIERLTHYVHAGGCLLITEKSGIFTDEPRKRAAWPFSHLFAKPVESSVLNQTEAATIDPHAQFKFTASTGKPASASFGRGRVAYLPKIDFIHQPRTFSSKYNTHYDGIDSRYWKSPRNADQILKMIDDLSPAARCVSVTADSATRLDLIELSDQSLAVPLFRCGTLHEKVHGTLVLHSSKAPTQARLYQPGRSSSIALEFARHGDGYQATLPELGRLSVVTLGITRHELSQ